MTRKSSSRRNDPKGDSETASADITIQHRGYAENIRFDHERTGSFFTASSSSSKHERGPSTDGRPLRPLRMKDDSAYLQVALAVGNL